MGLYLMIQNEGVADYNSLMLFGATGNRYSTNPMTIGTFGSGSKHSVGVLLRNNINLSIFAGLTKLNYYSKPKKLRKASGGENNQQQVCVHISGALPDGDEGTMGHKELSMTLDFGSNEWTSVALAIREYVSNAIDGQLEMTGDFAGVKIEIVDESKVRAKAGFTRVFIPLTSEVQEFYSNLGKWFLHFSEPEVVRNGTKVLTKANRNTSGNKWPVIYRRGVLVREIRGGTMASAFDYNLDIVLNESRTFDDYNAKREVAVALRNATSETLSLIFLAMRKGEPIWELTLDEYGLVPSSWEVDTVEMQAKRAEQWQGAAALAFGDNTVLCDDVAMVGQMVEKKGYNAIPVKSRGWIDAAKQNGLLTDEAILTKDDKVGRAFFPATDAVTLAVEIVWKAMTDLGFVGSKSKPNVGTFTEPIDCEGRAMGLYRPEVKTVYANTDYSENLDALVFYKS